MKTDLFPSCGHCWVFQTCWHIECSTFTASSFRIWNSSTGIPSPPLALLIVVLSKAHLTSHSRMSDLPLMLLQICAYDSLCSQRTQIAPMLSCSVVFDSLWPHGLLVHGIFHARILEWDAIPFSKASSWPRDQTHVFYVSCIGKWFFTTRATWRAPMKSSKILINIDIANTINVWIWKQSLGYISQLSYSGY